MANSRVNRTATLVANAYDLYEHGHSKEYILDKLEILATNLGKWSNITIEERKKKLEDIIDHVISKKINAEKDKIIIDNPLLKENILDVLNDKDLPIHEFVDLLIRTVAEDIHARLERLVKDYANPENYAVTPLLATLDQIMHIRYGSQYENK